MSWGIIRILIAVGNWLADTCKHENWGGRKRRGYQRSRRASRIVLRM
jgi:hypothetical protein